MCPVHKTALVIPFVHSPKYDFVTHRQGNSLGKIDIVCDQQGMVAMDLKHEALVPRTIMIIGK